MHNHTDSAKLYLKQQHYFSTDPSHSASNNVARLMTEFATIKAQQFAEWVAKSYYTFDFIGERWYRLIEGSAGETVKESCTTAELYNSEEFKRYKEGKG